MANKLNAIDVVDVEYLHSIARDPGGIVWTTDIETAMTVFAYSFLEAPDVESQNEVLRLLLEHATFGTSTETNEDTIAHFADFFCLHRQLLRTFAKQEGIRLKRE
jgi:hypothetical protein